MPAYDGSKRPASPITVSTIAAPTAHATIVASTVPLHAGQTLSRTMLLQRVWDMNHDPMTNVVDVHINRLRRKIDPDGDCPLIHTIRGVCYVMQADRG